MAKSEGTTDPGTQKAALLEAMLDHVPFDGWSPISFRKAAADVGLSEGEAMIVFPRGADDALDAFIDDADDKMVAALAAMNMREMRIRDRIRAAVRARIEAVADHREAERRAVGYLALPLNAPRALRHLARTVDLMWRAAGDTSTDFSFYTKRMLLSGVYSSTLMYWLNDSSDDHDATWAFLDRRIDDVMQIEKLKAKVKERAADMPAFTKALSRLRYPSDTRMKP